MCPCKLLKDGMLQINIIMKFTIFKSGCCLIYDDNDICLHIWVPEICRLNFAVLYDIGSGLIITSGYDQIVCPF